MNDSACFSDELNICSISVISGTRPCGRTTVWEDGRSSHAFLYIREGEAVFCDNSGRTLTAANGCLVFLPKGTVYRMRYSAAATTFVLVNFDLLDRHGVDVLFSETVSVVAHDDETLGIAKIMLKFEQCSASKNVSSVLRRKELCYRIFERISDSLPGISDEADVSRQIVKGVRLLKQTYLENLPVVAYADASHISVSRFRELFQKQFGMSPVKYRNKLRIERAGELLAEEDLTVAEVAYAAGFGNIGYFYRCYTAAFGETPVMTRSKHH